MARTILDRTSKGISVINANDFSDDDKIQLYEGGLARTELEEALDFAPAWLPSDLIDFYSRFSGAEIGTIEVMPPGPLFDSSNALKELNKQMVGSCSDTESFFAIAYLNEDSYIVIQRGSETKFRCGKYDFGEHEWYDGAPFQSFTDWMYSQKS